MRKVAGCVVGIGTALPGANLERLEGTFGGGVRANYKREKERKRTCFAIFAPLSETMSVDNQNVDEMASVRDLAQVCANRFILIPSQKR